MDSRASQFLDRFKAAELVGSPIHLFAEDPDGFGATIAEMPGAFVSAIDVAADRSSGSTADLVRGSFASAACDKSGSIKIADQSFLAWLQGPDPLSAVVRDIRPDKPQVSMIADDATGRPIALAAGSRAITRNWPLDPAVRQALDSNSADYAVIAFRPSETGWRRAGLAYGLAPFETRLVAALARIGDLKQASKAIGVTYETARTTIAEVIKKTGSRRQTDLVRKMVRLAAGDLRAPDSVAGLFAELFGLTISQARLARALALGTTRDQAAELLGLSVHRAKSDLKAAFTACGVANAVDLSRIVAEVDVLAGLATACHVEINIGGAHDEPLLLVRRDWAEGKISISDFGPRGGVPVLIFNTSLMGRAISPTLIATLQKGGFRPISFDRAGFGLTDDIDGDPWTTAASDARCLLDALGIERALILSRGCSHGVLATAAAMPARIAGGVLLAPDSPARLDGRRRGMIGHGRALLFDNALVVEGFAKLLGRRSSSAQIERLLRGSVAASAIDLAVLDDPAELGAFVRASRQAGISQTGFVREILAMPRADPQALHDASNWTLMYGGSSPMYRFHEVEKFWRAALPGVTEVCIPDGGHYLHVTHAEAVASALRACAL
jgi:pimeloyl-ACP methyl ester carboxylesterase/DNA-binding CsgD family transcriptional regulator